MLFVGCGTVAVDLQASVRKEDRKQMECCVITLSYDGNIHFICSSFYRHMLVTLFKHDEDNFALAKAKVHLHRVAVTARRQGVMNSRVRR